MTYIPLILSFLFTALAGMFSAVMSSVDNEPHYLKSIFSKWKPTFWSKQQSAGAKRISDYPINAWHLSQSAMYACFMLAGFCIYLMPMEVFIYVRVNHWWVWLPFLVVYGVALVVPFNLCYNHLFKLK